MLVTDVATVFNGSLCQDICSFTQFILLTPSCKWMGFWTLNIQLFDMDGGDVIFCMLPVSNSSS